MAGELGAYIQKGQTPMSHGTPRMESRREHARLPKLKRDVENDQMGEAWKTRSG